MYEKTPCLAPFFVFLFEQGVLQYKQAQRYTRNLLLTYDVRAKRCQCRHSRIIRGKSAEIRGRARVNVALRSYWRFNRRVVAIGSTEFIHHQLLEQRERGMAILLIDRASMKSFALSDRIAVMYQGKFVGVVPAEKADRETIDHDGRSDADMKNTVVRYLILFWVSTVAYHSGVTGKQV